jgi:hypothetical protein
MNFNWSPVHPARKDVFCLIVVITAALVIDSSFRHPLHPQPDTNSTYIVKAVPSVNFKLDGDLNDSQWQKCNVIKDLMSPWVKEAKDHTIFRAFHDDNFFYFSFVVQDSSMTVYRYINEESILGEDRGELFFTQNTDLNQYFGFEMDPQGKTLDYEARLNDHVDFKWNMENLAMQTKQHPYGYELEGRLPLSFFRKMAIKNKTPLSVYGGVFRGDYFGKEENAVTWFSWLKPASATPNFHIPSSFGTFIFENASK